MKDNILDKLSDSDWECLSDGDDDYDNDVADKTWTPSPTNSRSNNHNQMELLLDSSSDEDEISFDESVLVAQASTSARSLDQGVRGSQASTSARSSDQGVCGSQASSSAFARAIQTQNTVPAKTKNDRPAIQWCNTNSRRSLEVGSTSWLDHIDLGEPLETPAQYFVKYFTPNEENISFRYS